MDDPPLSPLLGTALGDSGGDDYVADPACPVLPSTSTSPAPRPFPGDSLGARAGCENSGAFVSDDFGGCEGGNLNVLGEDLKHYGAAVGDDGSSDYGAIVGGESNASVIDESSVRKSCDSEEGENIFPRIVDDVSHGCGNIIGSEASVGARPSVEELSEGAGVADSVVKSSDYYDGRVTGEVGAEEASTVKNAHFLGYYSIEEDNVANCIEEGCEPMEDNCRIEFYAKEHKDDVQTKGDDVHFSKEAPGEEESTEEGRKLVDVGNLIKDQGNVGQKEGEDLNMIVEYSEDNVDVGDRQVIDGEDLLGEMVGLEMDKECKEETKTDDVDVEASAVHSCLANVKTEEMGAQMDETTALKEDGYVTNSAKLEIVNACTGGEADKDCVDAGATHLDAGQDLLGEMVGLEMDKECKEETETGYGDVEARAVQSCIAHAETDVSPQMDENTTLKEDGCVTNIANLEIKNACTGGELDGDYLDAGVTRLDDLNAGEGDNEVDNAIEGEQVFVDNDPMEDDEEDESADPIDDNANMSSALSEGVQNEGAAQMDEDCDDSPPPLVNQKVSGRRKRGRSSSSAKQHVVKTKLRKKDSEGVCFICFDGGELVECDRRHCTKAYHASCVNRDDSFFHAKGRWNCGWHICSNCQKPAHFMCFTCTHSLCKGCKSTSFFKSIRGQKGFCETCLSTVLLIENKERAMEQMDGINFDDEDNWWHLFKDYWLDLKSKLSITPEEILLAKSQVTGSSLIDEKENTNHLHNDAGEQAAISGSSSGKRKKRQSRTNASEEIHTEKRSAKRSSQRGPSGHRDQENTTATQKKSKRNPKTAGRAKKDTESVETSTPERVNWASKELRSFVAHMKGGDKSPISQYEVQELLLKYITQNKLRDPRKKSYILCDQMLQNLFGKPHVGHFEMLKLIESHFLANEASQVEVDDTQGGVVDPDPCHTDGEGNSDAGPLTSSDRKKKSRKKHEEKGHLANYDDYAAVDVHNINLIYLRRNLVEELLDDIDKRGDLDSFTEKVTGTFVKIRVPGPAQRQDVYRLVRVLGVGMAAEEYKVGKRTTNVLLEIVNLDKIETITVDIISNQGFTEEECKRLRQSVRCGFVPRLRVGEIQEKSRSLQTMRVNDWIETEKSKLQHLRDRASDLGRKKELRECVEKLQLLSTPEERARRMREEPEIHTMGPEYESSEESEAPDHHRQRESSLWKGSSSAQGKDSTYSTDSWKGSQRNSKGTFELGNSEPEKLTPSYRYDKSPYLMHKSNASNIVGGTATGGAMVSNSQREYIDGSSKSLAAASSVGVPGSSWVNESEKIWHYVDPAGKIQGPFSMTQLRKWNTTGYFPPNMKIWRATESQDDSILLSNALMGNFQRETKQVNNPMRIKDAGLGSNPLEGQVTKYGTNFRNDGASRDNNPISWQSQKPSHVNVISNQSSSQPVLVETLAGNYSFAQNSAAQSTTASFHGSSLVPVATNAAENAAQSSAQGHDVQGINNAAPVGTRSERLPPNIQQFSESGTGHIVPVQPASQLVGNMQSIPTIASTEMPSVATASHGQGTGITAWGTTAVQGNANMQWNVVAPGSVNMGWVAPAQGIANLNMSVAPTAKQQNAVQGMGWATPNQVNSNVNATWATAQGAANQNPTMMNAQLQGLASAWASQNNPNASYPGWVAQASSTSNQNGQWVNQAQSYVNSNAGYDSGHGVAGGNNNPRNVNNDWNSPGFRDGGRDDNFRGGPRGNGVCGFFMRGNCIKGSQCRHYHPPRN